MTEKGSASERQKETERKEGEREPASGIRPLSI